MGVEKIIKQVNTHFSLSFHLKWLHSNFFKKKFSRQNYWVSFLRTVPQKSAIVLLGAVAGTRTWYCQDLPRQAGPQHLLGVKCIKNTKIQRGHLRTNVHFTPHRGFVCSLCTWDLYIFEMSLTLLSLRAAEGAKGPFRGTGPWSMGASGAAFFEILYFPQLLGIIPELIFYEKKIISELGQQKYQ